MTNEPDTTATDAPKKAKRKKTTRKKKPAAKKTAKRKTKSAPRKKRTTKAASSKRVSRPFPMLSLEESIVLPQTIREQNNGHPWDTELASQASLGVKRSNNKFFYLAASSRDYDLTVGTRDTDKIELSDLGRKLVFAGSEQERQQALVDAFFSVDIFKRVFDHYGGSNLPKEEFLTNTLQNDFGIDPSLHSDFARIFKANCSFLGIDEGLGAGITKRETLREDRESDIRVVGEPKGKFDRTAFVIMPFSEKGDNPRPSGFFTEVLASLITPAANAAGFAVETAGAGRK